MIERGANWEMHLADCESVTACATWDALVTDPPYGVNLGAEDSQRESAGAYRSHDDSYESFCASVVPRINAAIVRSKRAAVFSGPHIHEQKKPDAIGGIYCPAACSRHVWGFKTLLPILLYGAKPHRGSYSIVLHSTESVDRDEVDGHPVPKPIGWMLWLVGFASADGEVIYDPFAGTATTGVATLRVGGGRRFIGVEKDPEYFKICVDRLRAEESNSTLAAVRNGQASLFK